MDSESNNNFDPSDVHSLMNNADYLILHGSRCYGTATEKSDMDYRGFILEPAEHLLGFKTFHSAREHVPGGTIDTTIYSFSHYFKLLMKGSPETVEQLFHPNPLKSGRISELLRNNSNLFITIHTIRSTLAFADASMKKFGNNDNPKEASHACRLVEQAMQLCENKRIEYPLSIANTLIRIKNGELSRENVQRGYGVLRQRAEEIMNESTFVSHNDPKIEKKLFDLYLECVEPVLTKSMVAFKE